MASTPRRSSSRAPARDGTPAPAWLAAAAEALAARLPGERWFPGKTRSLTGLRPLDWALVPGTGAALALFEASFAAGESQVYFAPVGIAGERNGDALDDGALAPALLEAMRAGATLPGVRGVFRFAATPVLGELLPAPAADVTRLTAEQSNTSRVVGDRVVLKILRRLEPGLSPELELTRFLTGQTAFREAPRLVGYLLYEAPAQASATLATAHELIRSEGDAWALVMGRLEEYYGAAGGGAGEPTADPAFARALAAADATEARALGGLTGRMHRAFASAPPGSSMAPEAITADDLAAWRNEMERRLETAGGMLAGALDTLAGDAREAGQRVLEGLPRLREQLGGLDALATEEVIKLRVHGDYHLGQILRAAGAFTVVDFEGEPSRALAARRAKACALRDVAGMLRSFAYASRAALRRTAEAAPDSPRLAERLAPWAEAWEDGVREAFLDGYVEETGAPGPRLTPRAPEALDAALAAFELDKTAYELEYELGHRPTWVHIPVDALARLVAPARPRSPRLRPGAGPFRFTACLELREFLGVRAENERQLLELIDQVPLDSIYFHTHGFLLRHKFATGLYPNDFATWAAVHARDQVLGERLALVDPGEFPSLEALREELVAVIDDHLRAIPMVPRAVPGEPFDFIRSRIVEVPTGVEARTLAELRQALLEVDSSALYFHLVEARLRLGRGQNDFAAWLEHGLGLADLAARARAVSPYGSLERTRVRLLTLCDEALAEGAGRGAA